MNYDKNGALLSTSIPGLPEPARGKVRDVYDLGDSLLMVATDRISAFDYILPNGIPDKGRVLNQLSLFWFGTSATFQTTCLPPTSPSTPPRCRACATTSAAARCS